MAGPWEDYPAAAPVKSAQASGPWSDYANAMGSADNTEGLKQMGRNAVNELPTIGGIAGAALGTPADVLTGPAGTVAGAGMGGFLGTAAKNLINHYIDPANSPQTTTQAIAQPIMGGMGQAAATATGEFAAPYIARAVGKVTGPVSEWLDDMATRKAVEATGATGKQAAEFAPEAGRELLDRGIVKFGNSQGQVAAKTTAALEQSASDIGETLKGLDAKGATVDQADIIDKLRQRALALGEDPSQFGVSDSLNRLADRLQTVLESKGGDTTIALGKAEATKRGFQQAANYNSSPLDLSVSKEAANVYRQAVEDAATKFDAAAGQVFKTAKKTYGLLSPIEEATTRRAMTLAQSPKGGLMDTVATGVGAGLGGAPGAMIAAPARRILADRIAPSMAGLADMGAGAVGQVPAAAGAMTTPSVQFGAGLMAPGQQQPPPPPDYSTI